MSSPRSMQLGEAGVLRRGMTTDTASPETAHRSLRALAALGLPGRGHAAVAPLTDPAWAHLVARAVHDQLSGVLQWGIWNDEVPATDHQRRLAFDAHLPVAAHVVRLDQELATASRALKSENVDLRVIRGPAVARLDYPDPGMRTFNDIDLIVRGEQMRDAVRTLGSLGYRRGMPPLRQSFDDRFAASVSLVSASGLEIDLHRRLVDGPAGLTLPLEDLWGASEPIDVAGSRVEALPREHRLLDVAVTVALCPGSPRLGTLRDLATMLVSPSLDPAALLGIAEKWNAHPLLSLAVGKAWTALDLDDDVPAWWSVMVGRPPSRPEELSGRWTRWVPMYRQDGHSFPVLAAETMRILPVGDRPAFALAVGLPQRRYLRSRGIGRVAYWRSGISHLARPIAAQPEP